MRNPPERAVVFSFGDCCLRVAQSAQAPEAHYMPPLLLRHNPTFSCVFYCLCMFYAAFILFGQIMWW